MARGTARLTHSGAVADRLVFEAQPSRSEHWSGGAFAQFALQRAAVDAQASRSLGDVPAAIR
jgi:hypothetical protein